jgi:hypothetical protein
MNSSFHPQATALPPAAAFTFRRRWPSALLAMTTTATALLSAAAMACAQTAAEGPAREKTTTAKVDMKIRITVQGKSATATLSDTQASRDFASMLPLTLTLKDYAGTEKIGDLPRKLSTRGDPSGYTPSTGDISFYAPWGNLAIFYRDGRHSEGLFKLGKIYAGMEVLNRSQPFEARVELTD